VATTLADLHDLGVNHGAMEAAHILLDEQGRPVLCSFGRAEQDTVPSQADALRRQDVWALAHLLLACVAPGSSPRLVRTLRVAAGLGRRRRSRDARWLARRLACLVSGVRPPVRPVDGGQTEFSSGPLSTSGWRWVRPVFVAAAGAGCCIAAATALIGTRSSAPSAGPSQPLRCPPVDEGCGTLTTPGGILTVPSGRYLVARPGDIVVVGRWQCGPALPAVLRPATGRIWTFSRWPGAGRPVVGRLVAEGLHGAWTLRVLVRQHGCDQMEVERHGQSPLTVVERRR
jgi:hypothetical protein